MTLAEGWPMMPRSHGKSGGPGICGDWEHVKELSRPLVNSKASGEAGLETGVIYHLLTCEHWLAETQRAGIGQLSLEACSCGFWEPRSHHPHRVQTQSLIKCRHWGRGPERRLHLALEHAWARLKEKGVG